MPRDEPPTWKDSAKDMDRYWKSFLLFAFLLNFPPLFAQIIPSLDALRVEVTPGGVSIGQANGALLTRAALPYLAWRYAGEKAWREEHGKRIESITTEANEASFEVRFTEAVAHIRVKGDTGNAWKITGSLERIGARPIELARFHYLDGNLQRRLGLLEIPGYSFPAFVKPGDKIAPERGEHEKLWASMKAHWP